MRTFLFVLLLTGASLGAEAQTAAEKMNQMHWLLGIWTRTNPKPGQSGIEIWKKLPDGSWSGRGITHAKSDTLFIEELRIAIENDKLYYIADVPENKKPVYFEIVAVTANTFTCENPQHDFPKKILYRFDGTQLRARVSAGDKGQEFVFERETPGSKH